jgi:hypothetical protein
VGGFLFICEGETAPQADLLSPTSIKVDRP